MINNTQARLASALRFPLILLCAWFSVSAWAVNSLPGGPALLELNLQPPVTAIARDQAWLNDLLMIVCTVVFIGVFGVMFYSIWKHRKSVGHKAATFHESVAIEITWTIVPFVIIVLMAFPATKLIVAAKDTTNADLTVKVTGYQWKWGYDYLNGEGQGIAFLSTINPKMREFAAVGARGAPIPDNYLLDVDHPLVVPVNKKVRIITTSVDVIHSWAVPALGVRQDAIPGFVRDVWFRAEKVGTYYGDCTELCGKEHAFMPVVVKVLSDDDYTKWVAGEHQKLAAGSNASNAPVASK